MKPKQSYHSLDATPNQMIFAENIAIALDLPMPRPYMGDVGMFIGKYQNTYFKALREDRNSRNLIFSKFEIQVPEVLADWVIDNESRIGVYILWFFDECLYVGKTTKSANRVFGSYNEKERYLRKSKIETRYISHISFIDVDSKSDIDILEAVLISENKPSLNKQFKYEDKISMFESGIDIHKLEKIDLKRDFKNEKIKIIQE